MKISLTDDISNAVLLSLYTNQGEFWGDCLDEKKTGSKIHSLRRQTQSNDVKVAYKQYAHEALVWMRDEGLCKSLDVEVFWGGPGKLNLKIRIDSKEIDASPT